MTREQQRENFWKGLEAFYGLSNRLDNLALRQAAEAERQKKAAKRKLRLLIAITALAGMLLTIQLEQLRKSHGPSQYDKVRLMRLIDGTN